MNQPVADKEACTPNDFSLDIPPHSGSSNVQGLSISDEEEGLQRPKHDQTRVNRTKLKKPTNFRDALTKLERSYESEYKMYRNFLVIAFFGYISQFVVVGLADGLSEDIKLHGAFYVTPVYNMGLYAFGFWVFKNRGTPMMQKIFVILPLLTALVYTILIVIYLAVAANQGSEWSRGKIISFLLIILVHFIFNVYIPITNFKTSVEVLNVMNQRYSYKLKVRTQDDSAL